MASCSTPRWVSTSPYVKLTVTQQSETGDSAVLAWTLQYISDYAASTSSANTYKVVVNGSTVKSSSYSIDGKTGTSTISSGTVTVSKGTTAKNVSFSVSFDWEITWSGVYCGTNSASGSISVAKMTSYTVSYNANGGSGAPSAQTKWYNTTLALSSTKPTRTGHAFKGWATSPSGSVAYAAGANYTANATVTLYAVWQADTYTVAYNANGGSGAPSNQTKTYGVNLTLSSTKPTRTNYDFLGWGTSASSTTVSYNAGGTYSENAGITLYAIWQLAYTNPRITNFSINRCDSSGTASDNGTYAKVIFSWETDKTISSITVAWASTSGGSGSATISASGTSGSVSQVVGAGGLGADYTYTMTVTVADSVGSTQKDSTLPGKSYSMDLLLGGKGIAFGKVAELAGYLDSAFNIRCRKNLEIDGNMYDKFGTIVGNGSPSYLGSGSAAINPDTTTDHLILTDKNTPMGDGCFMYIMTFFFAGKSTSNNRAQIAIPYGQVGSMYHRHYVNDSWSDWRRHTNADEVISLANGGTGATTWQNARNNLRIHQATIVITRNGSSSQDVTVSTWTGGAISSGSNFFAYAINGDAAANPNDVTMCKKVSSTSIRVFFDGVSSGAIRLNTVLLDW